jgi:pilus assembly protein CpaF
MFAPHGGRFPPNLPPLSFSTALLWWHRAFFYLAQALCMTIPNQLQALLATGVTDVLISGPTNCQIDRGSGLERFELNFGTDDELRRVAIELALGAGARVDIAKPISDFSIDNLRCQVVLPFGVSNQTLISLRKHPAQQVTMDHLLEAGMLTQAQAEFLSRSVMERKTILIAGPTGAGKTTLLSALIHLAQERTIYIEQTPELSAAFPAVGLLEREANQEGVGAIDSVELLTHALRMRPDRLVIGEVRGREFGALLLAINNGHSAMATLHSQSLEALPRRLKALGHISGLDSQLTSELLNSIDLVVQLSRDPIRKVEAIAVLGPNSVDLELVPLEI